MVGVRVMDGVGGVAVLVLVGRVPVLVMLGVSVIVGDGEASVAVDLTVAVNDSVVTNEDTDIHVLPLANNTATGGAELAGDLLDGGDRAQPLAGRVVQAAQAFALAEQREGLKTVIYI